MIRGILTILACGTLVVCAAIFAPFSQTTRTDAQVMPTACNLVIASCYDACHKWTQGDVGYSYCMVECVKEGGYMRCFQGLAK